jgi:hypothetical protein
MSRQCWKCGEKLVVNEDLAIMECTGGIHIEAINLKTPQWWVVCRKSEGGCGRKGLAVKKQMDKWQKKDGNKAVFDTSDPAFSKIVFERNPKQELYTCKACGHSFLPNNN